MGKTLSEIGMRRHAAATSAAATLHTEGMEVRTEAEGDRATVIVRLEVERQDVRVDVGEPAAGAVLKATRAAVREARQAARLRTGSSVLDEQLGGGWPRRRIVEICGDDAARDAVLTLAMLAVREARRAGHRVLVVDCGRRQGDESALWTAAQRAGCITASVRFEHPADVLSVVKRADEAIADGAVLVVIHNLDGMLGMVTPPPSAQRKRELASAVAFDIAGLAGSAEARRACIMFIGTGRAEHYGYSAAPVLGDRGIAGYAWIRCEVREVDRSYGPSAGYGAVVEVRKNKDTDGFRGQVELGSEVYFRRRPQPPFPDDADAADDEREIAEQLERDGERTHDGAEDDPRGRREARGIGGRDGGWRVLHPGNVERFGLSLSPIGHVIPAGVAERDSRGLAHPHHDDCGHWLCENCPCPGGPQCNVERERSDHGPCTCGGGS